MKKFLIVLIAGLAAAVAVQSVWGMKAGETEAEIQATIDSQQPDSSEPSEPEQPESSELSEPEWQPQTVRLVSAGDNLIHSSLYEQAAARSTDGGYDFGALYENVADYFQEADIATLNQEDCHCAEPRFCDLSLLQLTA